jgi:hypothetical protein
MNALSRWVAKAKDPGAARQANGAQDAVSTFVLRRGNFGRPFWRQHADLGRLGWAYQRSGPGPAVGPMRGAAAPTDPIG